MVGIRLDQKSHRFDLAKELPQQRTLVNLTGGIAGRGDRHVKGDGVQRHMCNGYEPPSSVGSVEPIRVLTSQT